MRNYFYIILTAIIFVSCQREADIDLPDTKPKLSVSCFISDDIDTIRATVYWSSPVFTNSNNSQERPSDMNVQIRRGGLTKQLNWDANLFQYVLTTSEFLLEPGGSYELVVTAPNGERVSANTTIPLELPVVESATLTRDSSITSWGEISYELTFKTILRDPSPLFNRYRFAYFEYFSIENEFEAEYYRANSFKDDESLLNGTLYEEEVIENFGFGSAAFPMVMYVINSSEEYYRFHNTISNQSNDNPFAEPTIVYSNVENGLGIFAGYRQVRVAY